MAGASGSISESRRFLGEANGNPLQYSCLEIPWTKEPGSLQPVKSHSWTQLGDSTVTKSLTVCGRSVAQVSRSVNFPGKNTGVGCHFLLQEDLQAPGDLLDPGMVASPPWAGGLNSLPLRQSLNDLIIKPLMCIQPKHQIKKQIGRK